MMTATAFRLVVLALLAGLGAGCGPTEAEPTAVPTPVSGEFAVYLLPEGTPAEATLTVAPELWQCVGVPILSSDDIAAYVAESHELDLTGPAYQKVAQLKVPVSGRPFVVCVGQEAIYAGAFWVSLSSLSFNGIVIDTLPATQHRPLRIQLSYPESPERFTGEDRRGDSRIMQALESAGKLQ